MFEIKSIYFKRKVFSLIYENNIFKLLKYNKRLQYEADLNLVIYREFSGRYIADEFNGKIKEYDSYNNKLVFEGENINGKRNRKGKEYNASGILIFEGDYLNGMKNG